MKLAQPTESPGFFWLPGDPWKKSSGIVKFAATGEVHLELFESRGHTLIRRGDPRFQLDRDTAKAKPIVSRIIGIADRLGRITLSVAS